jgi:cephalosporin hydroxylase
VIESHFLSSQIVLVEGSSIDAATIAQVKSHIPHGARVMVILDSDHTHAHVRAELEHYAPLVTKDCYLVVMDSVVEDLPAELFAGKRWGKGNNPKTALHDFLTTTDRFEIDTMIDGKLVMTVAPDGFLRCLR